MRAVSSSSPSVKNTPPETPVSVLAIRPHASLAAGVCVFVQVHREDPGEPRHTRAKRYRVRFDLDRSVMKSADPPLEESLVTTFGALKELADAGGRTFAPAAAVEMLARREHSEAELRRKLAARGFNADAIQHALDRVLERGYQSDERFARSWIRTRMTGRGTSRGALLAGLAQRGIDRSLAEKAVRDFHAEHPDCFTNALRAAIEATGDNDAERIVRKLARRGFEVVEIRKNLQ